jgi:hypothetical protein
MGTFGLLFSEYTRLCCSYPVSLDRLTILVLSIPEGVVECRTVVHPVGAFTSIRRDCVGWYR